LNICYRPCADLKHNAASGWFSAVAAVGDLVRLRLVLISYRTLAEFNAVTGRFSTLRPAESDPKPTVTSQESGRSNVAHEPRVALERSGTGKPSDSIWLLD
jgi:hypothetical protein